ncbi:hypothetical protein B4N84_19515 [Flavobacterium sp. IR1]|nr:hypothetical protein B4N84_19515 [Flavobacterium sp. IR1]
MEKILKPYTIVPPHLYVERSADRQVKNILDDMGRPGYVLVSRQMGKTNLLINARRKFGNGDDRFVYVDLSNLFHNELQCFRNIIDTAIETNLDIFSQLEIEIRTYRREFNELPPHKQHEKELRMLLNTLKGKLIIILDEIDALTKVDYSDRIFAQIRSIYFARTNYNEFERLTYLLSGVVEPSELIKDPKISPFNIGEKIFLNDFSRVEFDSFLEKSKLSYLDDKIKNRIFYWTNGNPRLTWDLCCIIEDQEVNLSEETEVDSIVKLHYLTSFDKPPIDNIREIVKKESVIQDALIEIEYGKGDVVSDNIKQKLYLSGIINYTENDIKVKNRIIKESLSLQWINSIRDLELNLIEKGIELYNEGYYKKAINTFTTHLNDNVHLNTDNDDFNIVYYHLGLSNYYDNNFEEALKSLTLVNFDAKKYGNLYFKTELFKGYIHQKKKNYEDAEKSFNNIVNTDTRDEFYLYAKINLGYILSLDKSNEVNTIKSKKLFLEIANSSLENYYKIETLTFTKVKTEALFSLENSAQDKIGNRNYLDEALLICPEEYKPALLFYQYKNEKLSERKVSTIDDIAKSIIFNNLKLSKNQGQNKIKFSQRVLRELQLEAFKIGHIETFESLINYEKSVTSLYYNEITILDKLIGFAQNLNLNHELVFDLTEYLYYRCEDKNSDIYKNALYLLSTLDPDTNFKYATEYFKILDHDNSQNIDNDHLTLYITLYQHLINQKNLKRVFELINIGEKLKFKVSKENANSVLLFDFLTMKYNFEAGQLEEAKKHAAIISNQLMKDEEYYKRNPIIRQMGIDNIKNFCSNISSLKRNKKPIQIPKKIGRNDIVKVQYINNDIKIIKFKKVENDLKNGKCILVSNSNF